MTVEPVEPTAAARRAPLQSEPQQEPAAPAQPVRRRRRWLRYSLPGLWVALLFAALSFTPSLLPRSGLFQGILAGITGAVGYGLGVTGAWIWREFADRGPREPKARSWRILALTALVVLVVMAVLGRRWQDQLRDLMGVGADGPESFLVMPLSAAVVFVLLVAAGRGLRAIYRRLAALLTRWIGPRAARAVGWMVVAVAFLLLLTGVLFDGLIDLANRSFALQNTITPPGVEQPRSPLRSGGPQSLISWDSLGREGRKFTGTGPTAAQISAFTGSPAVEPIRIFAGLSSSSDSETRAQLAVRDLERVDGFSRSYLMVATSTGSGWLDPGSVDAFEYITGGDSAIVGMQYSHLPSWISFLVDQRKAREAGRDLYDAVYERWSRLPINSRPKLVVFGESLGSFGGEAAFSGERDLANRTSATLFAGPPSFNTLHREFTDERDGGTPEVQPVFRGGRTVRFANDISAGVPPVEGPWAGTRVVYLQHPSDPIVWWNPDLLFQKPDWLDEPNGSDVLDEMVWMPVITFWQVTADLPMAGAVPSGHGHTYTAEHTDAWAAILRPANWSSTKAARLKEIILASDQG